MTTTTSKEFIKAVLDLINVEFQAAGWVKRKPGMFSVNLSADNYGWVGLNMAIGRGNGILEINPMICVGNLKIEKFVAELMGLKFKPYTTAAIGTNVGYLMLERKYRPWLFQKGNDWKPQIVEMVAVVEEFGRQFLEQNLTLEALYETLLKSKRGVPPDPLDYRIAVASVLLGKRVEAVAFVNARLREIGARNDEAAEWFRKFATKLREL